MMHFRITTQDDCPYCVKAKDLITAAGGRYDETNISRLPELVRKTFKAKYGTVPQVFLGDELIGGSDDLESWLARLAG